MTETNSRSRRVILAVLLVLPLIAGLAFAAATGSRGFASAGSGAGTSTASGDAPAGLGGVTPQRLVDARRAAGEANSQAGFLTSGTGELRRGSGELNDGTGKLADGARQAEDGAKQLHDGMVQLQAGTGQLGDGATQLANGVDDALKQLDAIMLMRPELLRVIDGVDADLAKQHSPEAAEARKKLGELRGQAQNFDANAATGDRLMELKKGTRELSNQLAVNGYGYHDGVYKATEGSKQLADALGQLAGGAEAAHDGAGRVADGANRVDDMAGKTREKVAAANKAVPVVQPVPANASAPTAVSVLSPLAAYLVAALVMLAAGIGVLVVGAGELTGWRRLLPGLGVVLCSALVGTIALAMVSGAFGAAHVAATFGVMALAAAASAMLTRGAIAVFGPLWGKATAIAGLILQVAVVGFAWQEAGSGAAFATARIAALLMPMHYATSGLTALGNSGAGVSTSLWPAVAVLAAIAVVGLCSSLVLGEERWTSRRGGGEGRRQASDTVTA